jgi:hypothetical protein
MTDKPIPWFWVDFNDIPSSGEVEVFYGPPFDTEVLVGDYEGNTAKGVVLERVVLKIKVDLSTFEPADDAIGRKLDEIEQLKDGWFGPDTKAIRPSLISAARAFHSDMFDVSASVAPTMDGGILIEWKHDEIYDSAELEDDGGMYLHSLDMKTGQSSDWETKAFDPEALRRFMRYGILGEER